MVERAENSVSKGPFRNKNVLGILEHYKDIWALDYVAGVAGWDLETYMPVKGAEARGEALAKISSLQQKLFLDKDFVGLIHRAAEEKDLTDAEKGVVRILKHELKYYEKLPAGFIEEFEELSANATVVWRDAKEKKDFKLFEPQLGRIFEMNRQMAEYLGYEGTPYNAVLDLFEEGLTTNLVEPFFSQIKTPLKDLLSKIVNSKDYNKGHFLESKAYSKEKLMELNQRILSLFWADSGRLRLDVSPHPFTTSFSGNDTRITTLYHTKDFIQAVSSTVHEFGHALYDLQTNPELEMTPISVSNSMILQESQSRYWENFIGREVSFIEYFKKDFEEACSMPLTMKDLITYFNKVAPGPIRVEADEVTYHFHVMLRYEVEKAILEGKLTSRDVKEVWNEKMKEYLGITPKDDAEGVLQDIHWASGWLGYFPTYSFGTFLSAQWAKEMGIAPEMANIGSIKSWLKDHIHQYGNTYTMGELLKLNGMKFDPSVNLKYLEKKYSEIYDF